MYDPTYQIEETNYFILQLDNPNRPEVFTRKISDPTISSVPDYYTTYPIEERKNIISFPTNTEIEMFVSSGDIEGLRQLIQETEESGNECSKKVDFFARFMDKIREFTS